MKSPHIIAALVLAAAAAPLAAQTTLYGLAGNTAPALRQLDPVTGAALSTHFVTCHEALFGGLAVDDAGVLFSIDGYNDPNPDRLFTINPASGAGTVVGPTNFNWNFRMLYVHPVTDVLYAATDNRLFTIDKATGAATLVANMTGPGLGQITAMAINSQGQAYITNISGVSLFTLDLATGATALVGEVGGPSNWFNDLTFDGSDVLWGARTQGGVYTISTTTAAQTFMFGGNYTGLAFFNPGAPGCYANCDGSQVPPILNVDDFTCFINEYAAGSILSHAQQVAHYANCDGSTVAPALNVDDFTCFINLFASGCP
jgi:hypothetical protein